MTLLAPGGLWWLLMVVPVVGLFLFRRRISEFEIPALVFWEQTDRRDTLGRWGRRIRRWLSLLLQLLIVLMLVAALSEPVNPAYQAELLVVLDDSATMQTIEEDDQTRFDIGRRIILDRVRGVPTGVRTTVILAGTPPKIIADRETIPQRVRAALSERRPRDVNPQVEQAVTLARRKRQNDASTILVISDRYNAQLAGCADVEWLCVGQPHPNLAVAGVSAATQPGTAQGSAGASPSPQPDEQAINVILTQRGMNATTVTVSLAADGRELARKTVPLQDDSTVVRLSASLAPGDPFRVHVEPSDRFPLDNTACGVWPVPTHVRLQLVTTGNPFLEAALDQPDASLQMLSPEEHKAQRELRPPVDQAANVIILDSPHAAAEEPRRGRFIVFGGRDPFGITRAAVPATDLTPTQWSADNALLRDIDLLRWHIDRTTGMVPPHFAQCVAQSDDVPLIFVVRDPGLPEDARDDFVAIYVNFDLAHSNITRRAGFPVFLWNAIDHLLNRRPEDALISYATGMPLAFPPQRRSDARVVDPTGRDVQAFFDEGRMVVPFPEYAGFYRLDTGGKPLVRALNYVSDGVRAAGKPGEEAVDRPPLPRRTWLATLPPWGVLVAAAAALLLIETLLFHRGIVKMG